MAELGVESARRIRMNVASRALLRACMLAIVLAAPLVAFSQSIDVKDAWIKRNCLDRGTSDHPLHGKEFEACLRKQIEALPLLDKNRREFFGERYDPPKYVECRLQPGSRNNSACDVYILRRREWPEYWPEGAKRVRWPEAPKEGVYRKGMKPREYWEALCKAEAGEFVFKTVLEVSSVYNARPQAIATDYELSDRYVLEDPFSYTDIQASHNPQEYFVQPFLGHYNTYESRDSIDPRLLFQYSRSTVPTGPPYQTAIGGKFVRVPYVVAKKVVESASSRFAFTWRGIVRLNDRQNGIAGGELVVVDLATSEVLAIRRGFARSGEVRNKASGFWWPSAERCPVGSLHAPNMTFLRRVLSPVPDINARVKPLE